LENVILEILNVENRLEARLSNTSALLSAASELATAGGGSTGTALSEGGIDEPSLKSSGLEGSINTGGGVGVIGLSTKENRLT